MRVKSLASSTSVTDLESESSKDDKKSDQNVNNDNDPVSLADQTKGTIGPGGEKRLFDAVVENEGVLKIRSALSQDELLAMSDDNMPLRHFRAEKGNVEKAISKIKQTIAWRKEFEVDQIRHAFDSNGMVSNKSGLDYRSIIMKENETGKIYVRGYDKNGRAILILRPGKENSKLGFDELNQMRHLVYFLERAIACTREKSQQEKFIVLVDYTGFSPFLHAPPMSTTKHSISILQGHYPERMYRVYVCNAPLYFRGFWAVVKPFLDPVTREKMVLCSGKEGLDVIQRDFDVDQMEECAYGTPGKLREYNSKEYLLDTPFHKTFDEL